MKIVLGFFGLTRSAQRTAPTIDAQIAAPIAAAGLLMRRVAHVNLPDRINNPRSGEVSFATDRRDAAWLAPELLWIEAQDDTAIAAEFALAASYGDRFGDAFTSLRNLCHQLRSLARLWSLIELAGLDADDLVAFLRPDLAYLDPLDVAATLGPLVEGEADIVLPGWQGWGGYNDRFAFATARAARVYANRWSMFAGGCTAMGGMHSETFLRAVVAAQALRTRFTPMRAVRVRADGSIAGNDAPMMTSTPDPEATMAARE